MTTLTLAEAAAYCDQNKPPGARWHNALRMIKHHLDNRNLIPLDARQHNHPVRLDQDDLDDLLAKQQRTADTTEIDAKIDELLGLVPITEISKRVRIRPEYVVKRRQAKGLPTIFDRKRQAAEAALDRLYPLNFTDQKIAAEAGVSREMIQKMRKARCWPIVARNGGNNDG